MNHSYILNIYNFITCLYKWEVMNESILHIKTYTTYTTSHVCMYICNVHNPYMHIWMSACIYSIHMHIHLSIIIQIHIHIHSIEYIYIYEDLSYFYHSMNHTYHTCIRIRECFNNSSFGKHPRSMINTIPLYSLFIIR
mgnify:CR=1 FL=1